MLEKTSYCGLYCEDCIPGDARLYAAIESLLRLFDEVGMNKYAAFSASKSAVFEKYPEAVTVLRELLKLRCSGSCRRGPVSELGCAGDCAIRTCAMEKGYEGCWDCDEHRDCLRLERLTGFHPSVARTLDTISSEGINAWAQKRGPHYPWSSPKTGDDPDDKLAQSLSGSTAEILPFLPYLLQDLWELGTAPEDIMALIKPHVSCAGDLAILDLGCGKGAVGVRMAKALGCRVKGIDLMPSFIEYAVNKAKEWGVEQLCSFAVGDANAAVERENGYDVVIWGAVGNALGGPMDTVMKLKSAVKPGGYIVLNDAYLRDGRDDAVRFSCEYPYYREWMDIFRQADVTVVEEMTDAGDAQEDVNDRNTEAIIARADELKAAYPDRRQLFDSYVQNQLDECADLSDAIVGVIWLLRCG